jgi:hypothetical protein
MVTRHCTSFKNTVWSIWSQLKPDLIVFAAAVMTCLTLFKTKPHFCIKPYEVVCLESAEFKQTVRHVGSATPSYCSLNASRTPRGMPKNDKLASNRKYLLLGRYKFSSFLVFPPPTVVTSCNRYIRERMQMRKWRKKTILLIKSYVKLLRFGSLSFNRNIKPPEVVHTETVTGLRIRDVYRCDMRGVCKRLALCLCVAFVKCLVRTFTN